MCGIFGLFGKFRGIQLIEMARNLQHRGPDGTGAYINNQLILENLSSIEKWEADVGLGQTLLSIVGSEVQQPISNNELVLTANGEIYNYKELKKDLNYDFKTDSDVEVILALFQEEFENNLAQTLPKVVRKLDGDYAFVIYNGEDWVAVRDPIGVKPLFYGKNIEKNVFGIASERKALWKVGINEIFSLDPHQFIFNQKLVTLYERPFWKDLPSIYNYYDSKEIIKNQLKTLLIDAVDKRIQDLDKVGLIFSGGLDSTILAVICLKLGIKPDLYAVGTENSPDILFSKKIAEQLGLKIKYSIVDENVVRKTLPKVLMAIEQWNLMKLGVGMTIYLAAQAATHDQVRVLLSGQGADELFAGYNRHLKLHQQKGLSAEKNLASDVLDLYQVNLERDDAVTMSQGVELRVPYLDLQVINRAMHIPIQYKLIQNADQLRKCILREVALDIGVPKEAALRPKKAAQYGSGIDKILRKKIIKDADYLSALKESVRFIET